MESHDPYIRYTRNFFRRWLPLYDYFSASVFYVYREATKRAQPEAGKQILDICTGTGEVALRCAKKGAEVTAVDITIEMLEKARAKAKALPISFQLMDARALAFADASFDAAVISFALHDMPRRVRLEVLREAVRVSRKRVVVADYALPSWEPLRNVVIRLIDLFESPYFRSFANEGALQLIEECGLEKPRTYHLCPMPFAVYVLEIEEKA